MIKQENIIMIRGIGKDLFEISLNNSEFNPFHERYNPYVFWRNEIEEK